MLSAQVLAVCKHMRTSLINSLSDSTVLVKEAATIDYSNYDGQDLRISDMCTPSNSLTKRKWWTCTCAAFCSVAQRRNKAEHLRIFSGWKDGSSTILGDHIEEAEDGGEVEKVQSIWSKYFFFFIVLLVIYVSTIAMVSILVSHFRSLSSFAQRPCGEEVHEEIHPSVVCWSLSEFFFWWETSDSACTAELYNVKSHIAPKELVGTKETILWKPGSRDPEMLSTTIGP